jgi:DNA topoisomerase-2
MQTPIVKVFNPRSSITFYTEDDFHNYMESNESSHKQRIKYYKGLGTSSDQEVRETFGKKLINFIEGTECDKSINKAFHGKYANDRKSWLETYEPKQIQQYSCTDPLCDMPVDQFIDQDLIKFSLNDCERSIPNIVDGLKNSHRKILYAAFKKSLSDSPSGSSVKVAQFSGYVAEHTNYHHGEQCLMGTIIGMAQDFPGSNNLPPLVRDGQFGSRLHGGKDAASPRYIFTKLQPYTRTLYPRDDDVLLRSVIDDGDVVEPYYYVPILPNILINGCTAGIGTGWSCSVPQYNPLDLIKCVKIWLQKKTILEETEEGIVSLLPEIIPWYQNYTGIIKKINDQKFESYGTIEKCTKRSQTIVKVTELPIGLWTEKFKDFLEDLLEQKKIKSMKNYSKPDVVLFEIVELPEYELDIDSLKLKTHISLTNMVLFNRQNRIQRFETIDDIIEYFCPIRYEFYQKRKTHQLKEMKNSLMWLQNKHRFLIEIASDTLIIHKRSETEIVNDLIQRNYKSKSNEKSDYDYLLNMNIRSMSQDNINRLAKEIEKLQHDIQDLDNTDESTLWINDLSRFEQQYKQYIASTNRKKQK